ncbi:hypothetical protein RYZ27_01205 [Hyphomonas sp. FCG-A18]|uniref:hypothetical protein n=1 Tax=Hyphomonas sp. FCG-A18 TaxID=3080019 RepID=UPI002B2FA487|nr:hypothetical protein RYZ27_01205 [Hyphomonas sp. FCG-A18]
MTNTTYTLNLAFDIDQVTRSLQYEFSSPEGSPLHSEGRLAGTCHFDVGDRLKIALTAKGNKKDKMEITVTDMTLVSICTLRPGKYDLSPFDPYNASVRATDWDAPVYTTKKKRTKAVTRALQPLYVTAPNGQWEMSGYLSVMIRKTDDKGQIHTIPRLFYFDPESSAGNGGDVPD